MSPRRPIPKPTLIVQTVFFGDDGREAARDLGKDLYAHLTRPPGSPLEVGAGVPVSVAVAADRVDLTVAGCLVLVPTLGASSFHRRRGEVVERLQEWHSALGSGHVLPVFGSKVWRNVEGRLPGASLLSEIGGDEAGRRKTLDAIVLSITRLLDPKKKGTPLFISHAQVDYESTKEAAKRIYEHVVMDGTGKAFFDVTGIEPGVNIADQLDKAAGRGVFVMVRSDAYSSRIWCQRELLTAKKQGLPTLTVEVLSSGELRSLPYGGNGPSTVWKGDPAAVASRAMVEWLRARHFQKEATRLVKAAGLPDEVKALARPPELLDFAQGPLRPDRAQLVLYPDPELPSLEAQVLATAYPRLRLATPTTIFRRLLTRPGGRSTAAPLEGLQVAMSLSESPDVDGPEGYTAEHLRDATVYVGRSLIAVGAAIAYGGDFRKAPAGFTPLLVELVRGYNPTARGPDEFLQSYIAANLDAEEAGDLALTLHHLRNPEGLGAEACLPWPPTEKGPAPALYYSDMRRVLVRHVDAMVALGGAAAPRRKEGRERMGYGGRFPGVVEEAWRMLEAGKPLYVVGGFGGAGEMVASLLDGEEIPARLRDETWSGTPLYRKRSREIDADPHLQSLELPGTLVDLAEAVKGYGRKVLKSDKASLAWNGLTRKENRVLFRSRDPVTLAALVLNGLLRRFYQPTPGTLEIELVRGSMTQAQGLDALAVATFEAVKLRGAGEAIDIELGGAASRRRLEGQSLTAINVDTVDADWLYLVSLGPLGDVARLGERVEQAARETAEMARRHGFGQLGLVAFGGSVVEDLESVIDAMLRGLEALAGTCSLSWFESDGDRFARIRTALERRSNVKLTTREIKVERPVQVVDSHKEAYLQVSFDHGTLSATFLPPSGIGIASSQRRKVSNKELGALAAGITSENPTTPDLATLSARGVELARLLLGDEAAELLARSAAAKLVVVHDVESSRLPYEMLTGAGSAEAPAVRAGISRRLAVQGVRSETLYGRPPRQSPLRMLLVVDPLGDLPGARREGKAVEATLKSFNEANGKGDGKAGEKARDKVQVHVLRSKAAARDQAAVATRANFKEWLPEVDVLHYCGHAAFAGPGEGQSGLHLADGYLGFEQLRDLDMPRVVFVNSCEMARVRAKVSSVYWAASFAEHFLRAGVEAYLGTFWRVQDKAAARFAAMIYDRLAVGQTLEAAVTEARAKLFSDEQRDWANYVLYGDGRFRLVAG